MKTNFLYVLALLGIATGLSTSGIAVADEDPGHIIQAGEEKVGDTKSDHRTDAHIIQEPHKKAR